MLRHVIVRLFAQAALLENFVGSISVVLNHVLIKAEYAFDAHSLRIGCIHTECALNRSGLNAH